MLDFTKKVIRKGNDGLETCFIGFKGEDTVVLQNGEYGIPREYSIEDFESMFEFIHETDLLEYLELLEEKTFPQYDAIDEVAVTNEQQQTPPQDKQQNEEQKENKQTEQPKSILTTGGQLKQELLEQKLPQTDYYNRLKVIQCKDGSLSYRYRNVTVLQVKGKRKVAVYMTGKFLDPETFAKFDKTPEEQKATHNAYLYLNEKEDLDTIMIALDESIEQVDLKKDGDAVPVVQDVVHE